MDNEQKSNTDQLRDEFLEHVKVFMKDGKTIPLKLTRLQRLLWEKFHPWPPGTKLTYTQTSDGKYRWVPTDNPFPSPHK